MINYGGVGKALATRWLATRIGVETNGKAKNSTVNLCRPTSAIFIWVVAQSVEQVAVNYQVAGSTPANPAIFVQKFDG